MRTADSFGTLKDNRVDDFIEKYVYEKFDDGIYPVIIYENLVLMEEIDHKELINRLKELGFKAITKEIGIDNVLEVRK